ncbi:MAG: methionine adenosyltransferase [Helicobacter sp.]|nr:methionine adenosyltransferase [Helicobacter sp.]
MNNFKGDFLFTSESVTEGHPDKMADQVSDAVLDYIIARDKKARVACEVMLGNGFCVVSGELKTTTYVPIQDIARGVIKDIGYNNADFGMDYKSVGVLNCIGEQSPDISQGVDLESGEIGAGDQGLMFGYACDETPSLMPLALDLSHKITKELANARKSGRLDFLRPDGKSQVTLAYENNAPKAIHTIVVSTQHAPDISQAKIKEAVIEEVIKKVTPKELLTNDIIYHINPTGQFIIGGPMGDTGLTGRKIIVDTYGGACPHGGGAFSGKDPSKVDRSGAYIARYIAKNLVAAKVAQKALVQIAYAIGVVKPVSIFVNTFGTGKYDDSRLTQCVEAIFNLTPKGIIETLDLLNPIYQKTASYGHFGRDDVSWEKTNKVDEILKFLG